MQAGPFLIVPDNDPEQEFQAADLEEAHRICRERGYALFDVWTLPGEKKITQYLLTGPTGERRLVGDLWLAENAHRLSPDITARPALYVDGSTMIEGDIRTRQEEE